MINNKGNREEKEREREPERAIIYYCSTVSNKWNIKCCHIYKSYIFCICAT